MFDGEVKLEDRITKPDLVDGDCELDFKIRPKTIREYIGQTSIKENLSIYIEAAIKRKEALDHVLLYGPPGLGKTTLSIIIANELGVNIKITSGPAIEKAGDLVALLSNLEDNDVLFIDEIHRLPRQIEEVLYPAMEDNVIDIIIGKGPSAKSIRLDLPEFTLIGATTRVGNLSAPLRDRFGVVFRLDLYSSDELKEIIMRSAKLLGVDCELVGAYELGKRSRGTPRIANRLLKRARDFSQVLGNGVINSKSVRLTLDRLKIDDLGLEFFDIKMLRTIIENYSGGPVGLDTLSALLGEDSITIEDVYEPYLMQLGFLSRTPRGRCVTPKAYEYLNIKLIGQQEI